MTMLLSAAEHPPMAHLWRNEPVQPHPDAYHEDGHLALLLIALWELDTGRLCPSWPPASMTTDQMIDFWADPLMDPQHDNDAGARQER
jgi:hypothetical protein